MTRNGSLRKGMSLVWDKCNLVVYRACEAKACSRGWGSPARDGYTKPWKDRYYMLRSPTEDACSNPVRYNVAEVSRSRSSPVLSPNIYITT